MTVHCTQLERVRMKLERDGVISRNECFRQSPPITRLAARINDLIAVGFQFEAKEERGDFVYRLVKLPDDTVR
jgi:hypothetical protein